MLRATLISSLIGLFCMKDLAYYRQLILDSLLRSRASMTTEQLVKDTLLYPSEVGRLLEELSKHGVITLEGNTISLNGLHSLNGKKSLESLIDTISTSIKYLRSKDRPLPSAQFDQCMATPETTLRRFLYLFARGDLHGKQILLLGDDDMLSIPLTWAGVARSVQVLDIDTRVLSYAKAAVSGTSETVFQTLQYDVHDPLPQLTLEAADVVVTDPPYTIPGIKLFLKRASQALKKRPGSVCYLSYSPMDLEQEEIWTVQQAMVRAGFIVTDAVPDFNSYYPRDDMAHAASSILGDPQSPWFLSSWLRLEATNFLETVDTEIQGDIYGYSETE